MTLTDKSFDWVIVGGGLTGAALGYELSRLGVQVLVIEQHNPIEGATRNSYGGLAYWSGTTELTRMLCAEGIARHRQLSGELGASTGFRECDLLLTIAPGEDAGMIFEQYLKLTKHAKLLTPEQAHDYEPLLNPGAIAGLIQLLHGQVDPLLLQRAYLQAMQNQGGQLAHQRVQSLECSRGNSRIKTSETEYVCSHLVVCAGGWSRELLKQWGIHVPIYFTHSELIALPPVPWELRGMIMPAQIQRFQLESQSSNPEYEPLWCEKETELVPAIFDPGIIQFSDRSLFLGQISHAQTNPQANLNPTEAIAKIRSQTTKLLPCLADLPGTYRHCLVAFSRDSLPLIGSIDQECGLYIFSGFSNPFVLVPPLAQRFAQHVLGHSQDDTISELSPNRFK